MKLLAIKDIKIAQNTLIRFILPNSRHKINVSTYKGYKATEIAHNSSIFKSEIGNLWIVMDKTKAFPYYHVVMITYEALLQESVEYLTKMLNGGKFCHCYYNAKMVYEMTELHSFELDGKKYFVALHQNSMSKNRINYFWNYTQAQDNKKIQLKQY